MSVPSLISICRSCMKTLFTCRPKVLAVKATLCQKFEPKCFNGGVSLCTQCTRHIMLYDNDNESDVLTCNIIDNNYVHAQRQICKPPSESSGAALFNKMEQNKMYCVRFHCHPLVGDFEKFKSSQVISSGRKSLFRIPLSDLHGKKISTFIHFPKRVFFFLLSGVGFKNSFKAWRLVGLTISLKRKTLWKPPLCCMLDVASVLFIYLSFFFFQLPKKIHYCISK